MNLSFRIISHQLLIPSGQHLLEQNGQGNWLPKYIIDGKNLAEFIKKLLWVTRTSWVWDALLCQRKTQNLTSRDPGEIFCKDNLQLSPTHLILTRRPDAGLNGPMIWPSLVMSIFLCKTNQHRPLVCILLHTETAWMVWQWPYHWTKVS